MLFSRSAICSKVRDTIAYHPVTMLVAASGSGKSGILEEIFTDGERVDQSSCIFFRLKHTDSCLENFVVSFGEAVGALITTETKFPLKLLVDRINSLPPQILIVLDDLHFIEEDYEASRFLTELIERTARVGYTEARRWVLASRSADLLPHAMWMGSGMLGLLADKRLLRVDDAEAARLKAALGIVSQTPLPRNFRRALFETAKLRLGMLPRSARNLKPPVPSTEATPGFNANVHYLLNAFSDRLVDFLYATCLLTDVRDEDCALVFPDADELIGHLKTLHILRYDAVKKATRYDAVVRGHVRGALGTASPERIQNASRIALHAGINRAEIHLAFGILMLRKEYDEVIKLLADYGFSILDREPLDGIIVKTLRSLPIALVKESPVVAAMQAATNCRVDFSDISEAWFGCALQDERLQGRHRRVVAYRYGLEIARRRRSDAISLLTPLLAELRADQHRDTELDPLVHSICAAILVTQDKADDAISYINHALNVVAFSKDPATRARVYHDATFVSMRTGSYARAREYALTSIETSLQERMYDLASRTMSLLQELTYAVDYDLRATYRHLSLMHYYAKRAGEARTAMGATMGSFWIAAELGDTELMSEHEALIKRFKATDNYMQDQLRRTLVPGTARRAAWFGDFEHAITLMGFYAETLTDPEHQAYHWAEIAFYKAMIYAMSPSRKLRADLLRMFHLSRKAFAKSPAVGPHVLDVLLRYAFCLLILERLTAVRVIIKHFHTLINTDKRTACYIRLLEALVSQWGGSDNLAGFRLAVDELNRLDLGGLAQLVMIMPDASVAKTRHRDRRARALAQ